MRPFVIVSALMLVVADVANGQTCLHGPEASDGARARAAAAVTYVRDVNDAQARLYRERNSYVPLNEAVEIGRVPVGFIPRLTFDRWSYAISLKDTLDPCGFVLFSDQDGVVYEGSPTRRTLTPTTPPPSLRETDQQAGCLRASAVVAMLEGADTALLRTVAGLPHPAWLNAVLPLVSTRTMHLGRARG